MATVQTWLEQATEEGSPSRTTAEDTVRECIRRMLTKANVYDRRRQDAEQSGDRIQAAEKAHRADALRELAAEWNSELAGRKREARA